MYLIDSKTVDALYAAGVITWDPKDKEKCCGMPRDVDGRCSHRPYHSVYVELHPLPALGETVAE
jgi:hypothetical protein